MFPVTERILVVDDEAAMRTSIVRMLEKRGYSCAAAASSAEARALMDAEPFALVLTDVS